MALIVVAIHTNPQSCIQIDNLRNLLVSFYSFAVPFFFITSGFLLWNKVADGCLNDKLSRIRVWMKKTLRLYIVWTIIYLPFTIYGFCLDGTGILKSSVIFLRNTLLIGQNYWSWPLWYLLGMIVAGCMVWLMVKLGWKSKYMYVVAVVLAILGCLLDECHARGWFNVVVNPYFKLFETTRNGFFQGFPYIMIGITIATEGVLKSKKLLSFILLLSFLAHMSGLRFATFVMTYALFSLVIQFDLKDCADNLYRNCRFTSTIVYFVHMLWVGTLPLLFPNLTSIYLFIAVVILSFLTARIVIYFKDTQIVKFCFR